MNWFYDLQGWVIRRLWGRIPILTYVYTYQYDGSLVLERKFIKPMAQSYLGKAAKEQYYLGKVGILMFPTVICLGAVPITLAVTPIKECYP